MFYFSISVFSQTTLTGIVYYESNYSQQTIDDYFLVRRRLVKNKKKSKNTDLFIGFFGYELLNNLIDIKLPKQKNFNLALIPKRTMWTNNIEGQKKLNLYLSILLCWW